NGKGTDLHCTLTGSDGKTAYADVVEVTPSRSEASVKVRIYAGLAKGDRVDYVAQKCTEMGAEEIVFFNCDRCVVRLDPKKGADKKVERWQRIAEEAAKQSGRGIIPTVRYIDSYKEMLAEASANELKLFMYETGDRISMQQANRSALPCTTAAVICGPEGGNNGVTGGALIPMLTLGVPGDAVTAIMIGALTIQGLTPGPMLFETNKVLVYTIFIGMFVANTLMCICGFAGIRVFSKVLSVPKVILTPIIFALCIIGSFAMKNSLFDVWVMLIAGVVGYFLGKAKVPTSPAILGLILGPMAEKNFRTALLKSGGDPSVFFSTVICWFFIILIVGTLFGPTLKGYAGKIFKKKAS
ncbi:MAG: RsmE family RNA methyltransferase, partial [Oscillospiraceae bacterium]|nr:RsmE family RNA methyltransferase [Oscillospiraceae bacterium]